MQTLRDDCVCEMWGGGRYGGVRARAKDRCDVVVVMMRMSG